MCIVDAIDQNGAALTHYVRNDFEEIKKIYICILYHFSTLKCHMQLEFFLLQEKGTLFFIINTYTADGLAMWGAKASAAMIWTEFFWYILAPAAKGLKH